MQPDSKTKKKKIITPPPKHGVHEKKTEAPSGSPYTAAHLDPEDPQWPPDIDPTLQPWENEDERELKSEAEDPDAPQSL